MVIADFLFLVCRGIVVDSQATVRLQHAKTMQVSIYMVNFVDTYDLQACTLDDITGKLKYCWWSKKDKYNIGDDYVACADNIVSSPDQHALSLCIGMQSTSLGQVAGNMISAGVLLQHSLVLPFTAPGSRCRKKPFLSQNNSLSVYSLASTLSSCTALCVAFSVAILSPFGGWWP